MRQQLRGLPVKGRAPKTGYDREQFGPAWADVDDDRCDSRNQLLQASLTDVRLEPGSRCVVLEGDLAPVQRDLERRRRTCTHRLVDPDLHAENATAPDRQESNRKTNLWTGIFSGVELWTTGTAR